MEHFIWASMSRCALSLRVMEEEVEAALGKNKKKKERSLPASAKQQCAIWDSTPHAEISAPHNKRAAVQCTALNTSQSVQTRQYGA